MPLDYYHLAVKSFSRTRSSSAAVLAYRTGVSLKDPHEGLKKFPHRSLKEIHSYFVTNWSSEKSSEGTPEVLQEILNEVGRTETRSNSRFFKEIEVSLPADATHEHRRTLAEQFTEAIAHHFGIVAISSIHTPPKSKKSQPNKDDEKNHHVHILISTRQLVNERRRPTLGPKLRELDTKATLKSVRRLWQRMLNRFYRTQGIDKTVSCESYETLGIEKIPTIHEGPGARIEKSDRAKINSTIRLLNKDAFMAGISPAALVARGIEELKLLSEDLKNCRAEKLQLEKEFRQQHEGINLLPRQEKQLATLRRVIDNTNTDGITVGQAVIKLKESLRRKKIGKNAFYRLKANLPLVGDAKVCDANAGVDLTQRLFETEDAQALSKLKNWAAGKTIVEPIKTIDFSNPAFLEKLQERERLKDKFPLPAVGSENERNIP